MQNVPLEGLKLEDLCRIAIERGLHIHIGVASADLGSNPPRITFQFNRADSNEPQAYSFEINPEQPRLNFQISWLLMREIQNYAPRLVKA